MPQKRYYFLGKQYLIYHMNHTITGHDIGQGYVCIGMCF